MILNRVHTNAVRRVVSRVIREKLGDPPPVLVPGTITMSLGSITIEEDGGTFQFPVRRLGGSDGIVTVDYSSADITAIATTHYNTTSGTLTWQDGDSADKFIPLTPIDDTVAQTSNLQFSISLSNATNGAVIGTTNQATITINEDDVATISPTSWLGIPDPTPVLGYDFNEPPPADPATWDTQETPGFYFIDPSHPSATDSGNTYGYRGRPRSTIPTSMIVGSGQKAVIVGDGNIYTGNNITVNSNGNSGARAHVEARYNSTRPILRGRNFQFGNYCVTDGLSVDGIVEFAYAWGSNSVIRNCVAEGLGVTTGTNSGSQYQPGSRSVCLNCVAFNFGDWQSNDAGDQHGIKPAGSDVDVWILNFTGYNLQGDTCQIGDANNGNPTRIYVGNMIGYDNKENLVDVKAATDIIISGGEGYGFQPRGDDPGSCIIIHNGATRVWVLGVHVHDSAIGIISTGSTDTYVIGNLIHDIDRGIPQSGGYGGAVATHIRGSNGTAVFAYNTIVRYGNGTQITTGSYAGGVLIHGNIYAERLAGDGNDINIANSNLGNQTNITNNLFDARLVNLSGASESNSVNASPGFVDSANDDFTLQPGSPAIDAGASLESVFVEFETRYGLDIRKDFIGTTRPQSGVWDIGAYERNAA